MRTRPVFAQTVTYTIIFLYITANQLHGQPIISHILMLFYPCSVLWYNKPNKPKNHIGISFITWYCRKSNWLCDFKIWNSIQITEGSDNGDSNYQGSTVFFYWVLLETEHSDFLTLYNSFQIVLLPEILTWNNNKQNCK